MALEIGSVVEGVITGITNFGAFVRLPEGNTGLIHISEVADAFVEDVRHYLNEKDKVTVKILSINSKGKYDLSIKQLKQAQPPSPADGATDKAPDKDQDPTAAPMERPHQERPHDTSRPPHHFQDRAPREGRRPFHGDGHTGHHDREPRQYTFEDKISRFMKESEERLLDLKRNTEAKRGKGRGR
jgi:S1 RNA binding domain protein